LILKYVDLFSGIGAFHQGFKNIYSECVFACDIDTNNNKSYFDNYSIKPFYDINSIDIPSIPDFDILCAGFPCQPFSVNGHQFGFQDVRGNLFYKIHEILKFHSPSCFILENVKNLVHHDSGNTFKTILNMLESLNYKISYKVLNGKDFGSPQSRERIFIIGMKNTFFDFNKLVLEKSLPLSSFLDYSINSFVEKDKYTILSDNIIKNSKNGLIFRGYFNGKMKKGIEQSKSNISRNHQQFARIYSSDGYMPTILSQDTAGRYWVYIEELDIVRKITIPELYKIMGFGNDFKINISNKIALNQIGNSIDVRIIKNIVTALDKYYL